MSAAIRPSAAPGSLLWAPERPSQRALPSQRHPAPAYSDRPFRPAAAAAFAVSFTTTVLLFRIYLYRAGRLLPAAITAAPEPSRLIREAFLAHALMVSGIVAVAVGYELVIKHPTGHTDRAWILVILGGPILFLAGRALFEHAVFARVSRSRLIGALVLAGTSPAMILLPALAAATTAALVLAGIATFDTLRTRKQPPEPPLPPARQAERPPA
ncbi:low temperature requirement protein A [Micromonospora sp. NPDC005163]